MWALMLPSSISSKHSLTSSSVRVSRMTRVRAWAWIAYTSVRSFRVPAMDQRTVMPFNPVSKMGRLTT